MFFHTPTEVAEGKAPTGRTFRVGGLVEAGSIKRAADGITVNFVVTDTAKSIPVSYSGPLPDLFREGKRAPSCRASLPPTDTSRFPRCSPSTTRTTCRRKRNTRSTRPTKHQGR